MVGLGNPGPRYAQTRHNVGFRVVEAFAQRHDLALDEIRYSGCFGTGRVGPLRIGVLQPQTFVNASGESLVRALVDLGQLDVAQHLIVVYDDLDLPLGRIRLRSSGGAGGHRGVESIISSLGHKEFPRLRFGIGRPAEGVGIVEHVLAPFEASERRQLPNRIGVAVDSLDAFVSSGIASAMDRFNASASQGDPS